jgi:hypothetical protein
LLGIVTDEPYAFDKDRFYRLKNDAVIAANQSTFAGPHSDIHYPESCGLSSQPHSADRYAPHVCWK